MSLWKRILRPRRAEAELDEEVQGYFEERVERAIARGLTRQQAIRAVRLEDEGAEQVKQRVREVRMGASIETAWQDVRFAARVLAKSPGFTFFAVLTIALALGANAAIFSLVDGVLLKSTGYPEPERIVQLWERPPDGMRNSIAPANYLDWARQSQSFEAMAAVSGASMSYSGGGEPRALRAGVVSAPYFEVFGVKAAIGRTFARDEDQPGKGKVVVLTHRIWSTSFGADPAAVGRRILLDGEPHTVIGVLPGASEFDRNPRDIWVPLVFPPTVARDYHSYAAVARLKPGVTLEQAQAEMRQIAEGIARQYPAIKKGWGATVDRYLDRLVGPQIRLSLSVLMWAVMAVLLIACVNLANLLMARATLRSREMSLRLALGAGRGRVVRMLLTESLLIASGGAVAGAALGFGLLRWIQNLMPPFFLPAEASVAMDYRVMLFLAAATILTSVAFGLAPAIQAGRGEAAGALREGGRASSAGRGKVYARHSFVALQVAAAFILLVGAGLLIRSFEKAMSVDTGFETEGLIAGYLPMSGAEPNSEQLIQHVNRILEEIRSAPGVTEAAVATAIPLRGWGDGMPMRLPEAPDREVGTGFKIATPGYLRALGIKLVAGRLLNERDAAGSPLVVVVNESFVRRYYPNQNVIGKRILVEKILPSRRGLGPQSAWEIVGVVADEKGRGVESPNDVGAYASFAQNPVVGLGLVVRGQGDAGILIRTVQQAVWRVDKNQVVDRPMPVESLKQESMAGRRMTVSLLAGFALLATLLACAGIYGVLSFVTARRAQEMGIRAAMGATRGDLIRLVLASGTVPVGAGLAVGLAGASALGKFIESLLFQTKAADPVTLGSVSAIFLGVALVACLVPALRASRVDPMTALRQE